MILLTNMKKILTIFLTTIFLLITPVYIFAEESTDTTVEETVTEKDTTTDDTETEETTLAETLEEEETDSGISVWTVLFAIVGASLFILVAYYILKNFNL